MTLDKLLLTHRNSLKFKEPRLIGVGIEPHFAIGQRAALFLRTPQANVLWDRLLLLDEAVVEAIKALGGLSIRTKAAMAASQGFCGGDEASGDGSVSHLTCSFSWLKRRRIIK
jgi:hypothetical protein